MPHYFSTSDPKEIAHRLHERLCIDCKMPGMTFDPETGFPHKRCGNCAKDYLEDEKLKESRRRSELIRAAKLEKQHGADILDSFMGVDTRAIKPVQKQRHYQD